MVYKRAVYAIGLYMTSNTLSLIIGKKMALYVI